MTNPNLGILIPNYILGQPITVPKGEVRTITLYNGAPSGNIYYNVIYSNSVIN